MYDFAKDRADLGPALFLPWASWVLVWAALMILLLAVTGTCVYINSFTRLSGELFGGLIALLFLQQAVKVMRALRPCLGELTLHLQQDKMTYCICKPSMGCSARAVLSESQSSCQRQSMQCRVFIEWQCRLHRQGLREEFHPQDAVGDLSVPSSTGAGALYAWRLVNGFWGLVSTAYHLSHLLACSRCEWHGEARTRFRCL